MLLLGLWAKQNNENKGIHSDKITNKKWEITNNLNIALNINLNNTFLGFWDSQTEEENVKWEKKGKLYN